MIFDIFFLVTFHKHVRLIGGDDIDTKGRFVWDKSKTTFDFSTWSPGNPSTGVPDQARTADWIDLYRDGKTKTNVFFSFFSNVPIPLKHTNSAGNSFKKNNKNQ